MSSINLASAIANGLLGNSRPSGGANAPGGIMGEMMVSEAMPQYYSLVKSNAVFSISALGINPTVFTGGAAGTPIIGLYNPIASGKDLVILSASFGIRTTGSVAAALDFNWFAVNQGGVPVTGTQSSAVNAYSQAAVGSVAYGMVNTANTAALASTLRRSSLSIGLTTSTPGLNSGIFVDDVKGALIVAPGSYLALGSSATLTAASLDVSINWAEISI